MQEDKEPVFDALDALKIGIVAMTGTVEDLEPNLKAMKRAAAAGYATATDLADWLVRNLDLPFREAHKLAGKVVALAESRGVNLEKLPLSDLKSVDERFTEEVYAALGVLGSARSRISYGGTAPANVRREARRWIKRLEKDAETR